MCGVPSFSHIYSFFSCACVIMRPYSLFYLWSILLFLCSCSFPTIRFLELLGSGTELSLPGSLLYYFFFLPWLVRQWSVTFSLPLPALFIFLHICVFWNPLAIHSLTTSQHACRTTQQHLPPWLELTSLLAASFLHAYSIYYACSWSRQG